MAKMCQEMRFTHDQTNNDLPLLARIRRMIYHDIPYFPNDFLESPSTMPGRPQVADQLVAGWGSTNKER